MDLLIYLATDMKGMPEEYNQFLHTLGFRPASILHRMDALYNTYRFMRCLTLFRCIIVVFFE